MDSISQEIKRLQDKLVDIQEVKKPVKLSPEDKLFNDVRGIFILESGNSIFLQDRFIARIHEYMKTPPENKEPIYLGDLCRVMIKDKDHSDIEIGSEIIACKISTYHTTHQKYVNHLPCR